MRRIALSVFAGCAVLLAADTFSQRQREFWSFQKVRPQTPPAVASKSWGRSPIDAFILDDTTGQVMVDPVGAEISVRETTQALDSRTRTKLSPLLAGWGLNSTGWFGLDRPASPPEC